MKSNQKSHVDYYNDLAADEGPIDGDVFWEDRVVERNIGAHCQTKDFSLFGEKGRMPNMYVSPEELREIVQINQMHAIQEGARDIYLG